MDPGDPYTGLHLAMAAPSTHIFTTPELLDDDLLVSELLDDLTGHAGSLDERGTDRGAGFAGDQENLRKDDLFASWARSPIEHELIARADAILVTAVLEDRIHIVEVPRDSGRNG